VSNSDTAQRSSCSTDGIADVYALRGRRLKPWIAIMTGSESGATLRGVETHALFGVSRPDMED
jgi:hypothetical protein